MTGSRILVLGANGMAGHVVTEYLRGIPSYEVFATARESNSRETIALDVCDHERLRALMSTTMPNVVVNCVGVLVQNSERDAANAILVNSYLPNFLAALGKQIGYRLIHISTDCVFSGKTGNYDEHSFRDGDTVYARTKALGEVVNDRDLTIRTSIIGPERKRDGAGLLNWFLNQENRVMGFDRVFWSGVTTLELAKAIHASVEQGVTGLLHVCPPTRISKYDLLKHFAAIWNRKIEIVRESTVQSDKSLRNTRTDFQFHDLDYEAMLRDLKLWMDARPTYYSYAR